MLFAKNLDPASLGPFHASLASKVNIKAPADYFDRLCHTFTVSQSHIYHMTSLSGSDITPCYKIDKPPVVYRFSNVMKWRPLQRCIKITKILMFSRKKFDCYVIIISCDKLNLTFVLLYY